MYRTVLLAAVAALVSVPAAAAVSDKDLDSMFGGKPSVSATDEAYKPKPKEPPKLPAPQRAQRNSTPQKAQAPQKTQTPPVLPQRTASMNASEKKAAPAPQTRQQPPQRPQAPQKPQASQPKKDEKKLDAKPDDVWGTAESARSQYRRMAQMSFNYEMMQMQQKINKLNFDMALAEHEFHKKMQADDEMSDLNARLGPPRGAMVLPVVDPPAEAPRPVTPPKPEKKVDETGQPLLRVLGIQGYDGRFTAQILNNGGLTSVEEGMDLDNGIKILKIDDHGVKVQRTVKDGGKEDKEVFMLPFSR